MAYKKARSAITGRFASNEEAKADPTTHIMETIRVRNTAKVDDLVAAARVLGGSYLGVSGSYLVLKEHMEALINALREYDER